MLRPFHAIYSVYLHLHYARERNAKQQRPHSCGNAPTPYTTGAVEEVAIKALIQANGEVVNSIDIAAEGDLANMKCTKEFGNNHALLQATTTSHIQLLPNP